MRTVEITEFCISGFTAHCAVCIYGIYGACPKWMLPELSFSDRWSRGTKLWERDWAQRHSVFEWLCKHNRLRPEPIRFVSILVPRATMSDSTLSMRRVTGSQWIVDFRSWTWQRSRSPSLTKRIAASGNEIGVLNWKWDSYLLCACLRDNEDSGNVLWASHCSNRGCFCHTRPTSERPAGFPRKNGTMFSDQTGPSVRNGFDHIFFFIFQIPYINKFYWREVGQWTGWSKWNGPTCQSGPPPKVVPNILVGI